jgi:hypothetical protein
MNPLWLRRVSQPWLHIALLSVFVLAVVSHYGPTEMPYRGDRSYFAYLAQCILRGDSIYRVSFLGYPPLVPMLGAASM